MGSRIYKLGTWNQNDGNFNDSNELLTKNVLSEAIDTNTNMIICGGRDGCGNCTNLFKSIKDMANELNVFLKTLKIYLASCHYPSSTGVSSKIKSMINEVAQLKSVSFSGLSFGGTLAHIVYIKMSEKNAKVQSSATKLQKSNVITNLGDNQLTPSYTVTFKDHDGSVLKTESVELNLDATPPADPTRKDYTFVGWEPSYKNITSDRTCIAQYKKNKNTYKVTFKDEDNYTILKGPIDVDEGATAPAPTPPTKTGKTFNKWNPSNVNIQADTTCIACYTSSSGLYSNTITKRMFYNDKMLETLSLPNNIESIDESAFENCIKLVTDIPSNCKTIGTRAFYGCSKMTSVTIPSKCTTIEQQAFYNCSIPYVKIPVSIKTLGAQVFCSGSSSSTIDMTSFNTSSTIPSIQTNTFVSYGKIKFADVNVSKYFYNNATWRNYYLTFDPLPCYIITFNPNSGSGSMSSLNVIIGERWKCPENSYSRTDYNFVNFNSKADGSGTTYNPGSSYDCPSSDITLYAIWIKKQYTKAIISISENDRPNCVKVDKPKITSMLNQAGITDDCIYDCMGVNCTKNNILTSIQDALKDCTLLLFIHESHGGASGTILVKDGSMDSTNIYNEFAKSSSNLFIFASYSTCHAEKQFRSSLDSDELLSNCMYNEYGEKLTYDVETSSYVIKDSPGLDFFANAQAYFNELKAKLNLLCMQISANMAKGIFASQADYDILALNSEPNLLCWGACKGNESSYRYSSGGTKFYDGLYKNFNTNLSWQLQWDAFAYKSPAKGSETNPVKNAIGINFESKKIFTLKD